MVGLLCMIITASHLKSAGTEWYLELPTVCMGILRYNRDVH